MGDLTYESLMEARESKKAETGEFDMIKMANIALGILEQVNRIKGTSGGNNVMTSRPEGEGSSDIKPKIDVNQILSALTTVKQLKGDLKITELESLLKEHKDQVETLLGQL